MAVMCRKSQTSKAIPSNRKTQRSCSYTRALAHSLPTAVDADRAHSKSLTKALAPHVAEHYPSLPAYGVYPSSSDSTITLLVTGTKFSPTNYWNGRWRSVYTFSPETNTLTGTIKVDVHYYEDGNVRLLTTNAVDLEIPGGNADAMVRAIAKQEKEYQEKLNEAFGHLSEGAFKSLRRQLPITRQKIDWDKIGSYRLGQKVGLFPTHEH